MNPQGINAAVLLGIIVLGTLGAGAHTAPWPYASIDAQIVTQKPWLFRLFYGLLAAIIGFFCLVPFVNAASNLNAVSVSEIMLLLILAPLPLFLGCLWWAGPHEVRFDTAEQRFHIRRGFPGLARDTSIPLQDIAEFLVVAPRSAGPTSPWAVNIRRKSSGRKLLWTQFPDEQAARAAIARIPEAPLSSR